VGRFESGSGGRGADGIDEVPGRRLELGSAKVSRRCRLPGGHRSEWVTRRARPRPSKARIPLGEIDKAPDAPATAKAVDAERDARHTTAFERLVADLADDPRASAVVRLVEEGVDKPAAQAARLRCDAQEIYDANDRIRRHLRRIARELAAGSDDAGKRWPNDRVA